jgi:hypothetical protein
MKDGKRQRNNNRLATRKKARHHDRIDNYNLEQLYQEAKLDPQTVEGQGKIDIEVICPAKLNSPDSTQNQEPKTWSETLWSYLGY